MSPLERRVLALELRPAFAKVVRRERERKRREEKKRRERYYDALWAEAEFDAWRATRDW